MAAIVLPLFFISCYPMGLWTDTLVVSAHFFLNLLLKASLAHFSHLYLFWAHILCLSSLLGLGVTWAKSPHLSAKPVFSFFVSVGLWIIDPTIWLHHGCYSFTSLFHFLLPHGLVDWYSCRVSPLLHQSFTQGFLGPLFTSLPLLSLVGQHSYCASPFHYLIR